MSQIVVNLVQNAAHAMKGTEQKHLKVVTSKEGEYATINISDTGHGIDPEIVDQVFDPFFTTKGPKEGSGLGLSLVKAYVDSLNGEVEIERKKQGTNFKIRLPIAA